MAMQRQDPYRNFRFLVEMGSDIKAGFSDCSGFGSNVEVIQYREGGDAATVRKLPGKTEYTDIVLKHGITDSMDLYNWHLQAVNGAYERRDGSILLLGEDGDAANPKVVWDFFGAWPSKYDAPDLSAKGNDVAIDTFTLSCERLVRAK